MDFARDPRYWIPFAGLIVIIAIAALMRGGGSGEAQQVAVPSTTAAPSTPVAVPSRTAAASTPVAAHTPSIDEALLDARRAFDIAAATTALGAYHNEHGSYPLTGGAFQLICSTHKDAGCVLRTYDPKLESSDGLLGYWYQSDGTTYTLFTRFEAPPASSHCPDTLPPALAGGPVFCATSSQGGR